MNPATWLRIVAILIGGLALAALIWFGGPFLAFGEVRPFESFWVRLPIAVLLMLGALAWIAILVIRRRKATAALTEALDAVAAGDAEAIVGETAQRVKSVLHEDVRALYPQLAR